MKKQILYIHGGNAYVEYDNFLQDLKNKTLRDLPTSSKNKIWAETLEGELGNNFEIFTPTMPNKQNAKYQEWKIWLERYFPYLRDDIVLVGWSLGGMFLLKYLSEETFPVKIRAFYCLASPSGWFDTEGILEGEDGGDFRFSKDILKKIENKVEKINLWHSEDDFVVPFSEFRALAKELPKAETKTFSDKNHFLIENFPELIEAIKEEFKL